MRSSKSKSRKVKYLVFLGLKCRRRMRKRWKRLKRNHQRSRRRLVTFLWVLLVNQISSRVLHQFKVPHRLDRASLWANQPPQLLELEEVVADHLEGSRWVLRQPEVFLPWYLCTNSLKHLKWKSHSWFSKLASIMSLIRECQISTQAFLEQLVKTK